MSYDEDARHDPAMQAVNEAGGGEAEGFELAEEDLIANATHETDGGTARITEQAESFEESEQAVDDGDVYGEADQESVSEVRDPELGEQ